MTYSAESLEWQWSSKTKKHHTALDYYRPSTTQYPLSATYEAIEDLPLSGPGSWQHITKTTIMAKYQKVYGTMDSYKHVNSVHKILKSFKQLERFCQLMAEHVDFLACKPRNHSIVAFLQDALSNLVKCKDTH